MSPNRITRTEERPAGRGTIIVHEVDEIHPDTEECDLCRFTSEGLDDRPVVSLLTAPCTVTWATLPVGWR